jgi:hypothetical protein
LASSTILIDVGTSVGGKMVKLNNGSSPALRGAGHGGWTYMVMPGSAEFFSSRGSVKGRRPPVPRFVCGLGDGSHKLPIKAHLRGAIGKEAGQHITVQFERLKV